MYAQINIPANRKNKTDNASPKKSSATALSLPAAQAIQMTEDIAKKAPLYANGKSLARCVPFQQKAGNTLQPAGIQKDVLQPKYLRSDLKNMGNGAAGQWHQGIEAFHVTVYGDDKNESGARGFEFISNRWVSEFHITDHRQPFGRRFYNIDTEAPMKQYDKGKTGSAFDNMAADFGGTVLKGKQKYSDEAAQKAEELYTQESLKAGEKNMTAIREAATVVAQKYIGKEIDWSVPKSFLILGEIRNILKERMIEEVKPSLVKEQFDQVLTILNELAIKEKEAKMELKEEKSEGLLSAEPEQKAPMIRKEKNAKKLQVKMVASKIEDQKNSGKNNTVIITGFLLVILALILGRMFL